MKALSRVARILCPVALLSLTGCATVVGGALAMVAGAGKKSEPTEAPKQEGPNLLPGCPEETKDPLEMMKCPGSTARIPFEDLYQVLNVLDPAEKDRAAYVYKCGARLPDLEPQKTAERFAFAFRCYFTAETLDEARLAAELAELKELKPEESERIKQGVAKAREFVLQTLPAQLPRESHERDWQVYAELPKQIWQADRERRLKHAAVYEAVRELDRTLLAGNVPDCQKLRAELERHLKGSGKSMEAIRQRMADELGFLLGDSLARCYAYAGRPALAFPILEQLEQTRNNSEQKVTLLEQVHHAQVVEVTKDVEQAEKMPHLVGKRFITHSGSRSVALETVALLRPERSPLQQAWDSMRHDVAGRNLSTNNDEIASADAAQNRIAFKARMVPDLDTVCRTTNKIARIAEDGRIEYERVCKTINRGKRRHQAKPLTTRAVTKATQPGRIAVWGERDGWDESVLVSVLSTWENENPRVLQIANVVIE